MKKIAFIFPGQGAQYVGMGQDICESYPVADSVFEQASEAMGYCMKELCFNSSAEELKKTENTQPSVLTTSVAIYKVLEEKGIKPYAVAGLSLGEYSALVASGVLNFGEAVKLVRQRGKFMQEEVPIGVGGMAAILGLDSEKVVEACAESEEYGVVQAANFNCPGQVVIAGEIVAVEKAAEKCKEKGAKKAVLLPVSAPFHTKMLKGAGEKLKELLEEVSYNEMSVPVVANVHGDFVSDHNEVKDLLVKQVSSPVLWEDSVKRLIDDGVEIFVEVGPGNSLSKFVRKVSKDVKTLNVQDIASLEKTIDYIETA